MERHTFVGPIIQTNNDGKLIIQKNATLIVEAGKVSYVNLIMNN